MDVDEDSDQSFLNTNPLVKNLWVYIGAFYVYVLIVPIKESHKSIEYCRITNVCQARVLLLFSKSPGQRIILKDRMHNSRY